MSKPESVWEKVSDLRMLDEKKAPLDAQQRRRQHRRSVLTNIVFPFAGGMLLLIVLTGAAVASGRGATMGDILLTITVLCPVAICMLPIYLLIVVLISLMGRANQAAGKGLLRGSILIDTTESRLVGILGQMAKLSIRWNIAFAFLEKIAFRLFDPQDSKPQTKDES